MARKNFKPSKLQRKLVWALSAAQLPHEQIAMHIGIDAKTLRKWFPLELASAQTTMIATAISVLSHHLGKNDRTSAFFTLKALAGWRDQGPPDPGNEKPLTLEQIEAHIAFMEQKLGLKPGEVPRDPTDLGRLSPGPGSRPN